MPKTIPMVQRGQVWDDDLQMYRDRTPWDTTDHLLSKKVVFELKIAPMCQFDGYHKEARWPCPSEPLPPGTVWQPDDPMILFLQTYGLEGTMAKIIFDLTRFST
jgi:hypothetical protein